MITTTHERAPVASSGRHWGAWPVVLLLAGYALFCHGCHGDEDNELFLQMAHRVAEQVAR